MKRLSDLALENNCTLVGNIIGADRIDFAENFDATPGSAKLAIVNAILLGFIGEFTNG